MATALHDAELQRRYVRAGEEAAFAELVRRYLGLVYHAAVASWPAGRRSGRWWDL